MSREFDVVFKGWLETFEIEEDLQNIIAVGRKFRRRLELNIKTDDIFVDNWKFSKLAFCLRIGIEFEEKKMMRISNAKNQKDYYKTLVFIKRALNISQSLTIENISKEVGCSATITQYAENLFENFQKNWLQKQRNFISDFENDIYKIAAFYCCCEALGVHKKFDINQLIKCDDFITTEPIFNEYLKIFRGKTKTYINQLKRISGDVGHTINNMFKIDKKRKAKTLCDKDKDGNDHDGELKGKRKKTTMKNSSNYTNPIIIITKLPKKGPLALNCSMTKDLWWHPVTNQEVKEYHETLLKNFQK